VLNQPLVHKILEDLFAESIDAGRSERIAADVLAIHDGHHIVLRLLVLRERGAILLGTARGLCFLRGRLLLRGAIAKWVGELRFGRVRADQQSHRD
jgi:hypothetical protein